jgi:ankyrin repeat protein
MRLVIFALLACLALNAQASLDSASHQAWLKAIQSRNSEKLRALLPAIEDVNLANAEGKTALMVAATTGDVALIRLLIERHAKPSVTNRRGGTALMYAAANNQLGAIELLLRHGANVNTRAENGWTALTLAAAKGHHEVVAELTRSGANPNIPDVYGWTALMRAIEHDRYQSAKLLVELDDLEIDRINNKGQSALHIASTMKRCDMIRLLLEHNANAQLQDFRMRTPDFKSFCDLR